MPEAAVDNDVLIKAAAYGLLAATTDAFGGSVGILGVARFVVSKRLDKDLRVVDRRGATANWRTFLEEAEELEPSDEELGLATAIEEAAAAQGLPLDVGESQLCAIAIFRHVRRIVSGDKRAVVAAEQLLPSVPDLAGLSGRWVCLEQLVAALADRLDPEEIRAAICSEPAMDRALTICMSCGASGPWSNVGVDSYVNDLRKHAPTLLTASPLFAAT